MMAPTLVDHHPPDVPIPDCDNARAFYAKYDPKEVLGRGVSSTVRRCVEYATGREFAVKIIDLTSEADDDAPPELTREGIYEQVLKEIKILKTCGDHPHIMSLHDSYECSTFIFLVTEMCPKGELFDYMTEVVTLSEKRTRAVMRQLLEAVLFCHERKIVHRDLKPENVLLSEDFVVKLSDFGFATQIANDQELREICGTPGYLAPEVLKVSMIDGSPGYGRPVDAWACGVIMYTLLVGCPPFWHRRQMLMLRAIMEGKYSLAGPEWADISETPKDLISKLLVVDPADRLTVSQALTHPFFKREEVMLHTACGMAGGDWLHTGCGMAEELLLDPCRRPAEVFPTVPTL